VVVYGAAAWGVDLEVMDENKQLVAGIIDCNPLLWHVHSSNGIVEQDYG
jgi:hypothetical protein